MEDTIDRRKLLKVGAAGGAALFVPSSAALATGAGASAAGPVAGGTLDPRTIRKYVTPLPIPGAMPKAGVIRRNSIDYYLIGVKQLRQQILPDGMPSTTVWGYGSVLHPTTYGFPTRTIEATADRPVWVTWVNQLTDSKGRYLPHLLPVDQTLHWANPAGGLSGRDSHPVFDRTPGPYRGPVPLVTHVHGAHVREDSDGHPEAWYLPYAKDIPGTYARTGSHYDAFGTRFADRLSQRWTPGSATFEYANDQRASTLWFHDHTLGMTRLNVYAGPVGLYLIRGGAGDVSRGVLPAGPYEIPLVVQDRSFNADGSLFYPASRRFFDGFAGPYVPGSDIAPQWNPETFADTIVVNGRTWPYLSVRPRRYRFRILNACNARFLRLKITGSPTSPRPAAAALPIWYIGADGGYLPAPAAHGEVLLAPAERADVIVDFGGLPAGTELYLTNEGGDEPYGGGEVDTDYDAADPGTTGQVMKFVVHHHVGFDTSVPPQHLRLPGPGAAPAPTRTRKVSLNELDSAVLPGVGPQAGLLGTVNAVGEGMPMMWSDRATETPTRGTTEIWEIHNYTEDAHPVHLHQVQFRLLDRVSEAGTAAANPWETGGKDTVIAYPDQITRLQATFDIAGSYVWHCHILEHEDNEMMRPIEVT